jgi:phosphohistidine phosphatase
MEVYILRHAIAVARGTAGYPHDDRPLTDEGVKKMERAAKGIIAVAPNPDLILTSPMKRALETARIAARAFGTESTIEPCEQLRPGKSVENLLLYLAKYKDLERLLLVGHEPGMSGIASALLGFDRALFDFKKGALCRIDVATLPPVNPGTLIWHLSPKHLRMIGRN